MPVATRIEEVRKEVTELAQASPTAKDLMQGVCKLLHERMLKYNWVGFYLLEPGVQPPMLALGAFVGAMTPAHSYSAQPGDLWRGGFQRPNHCGGRRPQRSPLFSLLSGDQV